MNAPARRRAGKQRRNRRIRSAPRCKRSGSRRSGLAVETPFCDRGPRQANPIFRRGARPWLT